ncbi:MAG: hypothetical protein AB7S26_21725 [Sandaracinaceae bacterium]
MDRPRMRPVFVVPHDDPVAVLKVLGDLITEGHPECTGVMFRRHAVLRMKDDVRHFWSPYLYVEAAVDEDDELIEGPCLRGRFAPHPHVWTMFMAIYGVLALVAVMGLVYGASQWTLGWTPWALAIAPAALALIGFVYGAAFIGQGLGAAQMYALRSFLDRAAQRTTSG